MAAATAFLIAPIWMIGAANASPTQDARPGDAPVLWSGRLLDRAGNTTGGGAAAYIRPPASAVPRISDLTPANKITPIEPVLIGTATASPDGRFELRAVPPRDRIPRSWYGSDGSLQVMITATADNGESTIAFDTVYFLDQPNVGQAWFSDPQRFDAARDTAVARSADSARARTESSGSTLLEASNADRVAAEGGERPVDLRMSFAAPTNRAIRPSAAGVTAASETPPPYNTYGQCYEQGWIAQYNGKRAIAETSANTYWTIWSAYQTTRSTSWTIGVSKSGTSGWSVNGSKTLETEVGLGVSTPMSSGASSDYRARHSLGTIQRKFKWECTPGWPYDLSTHFPVYTNEVVGMTGGHFRDDGRNGTANPPKVSCNASYRAPVPPNSTTRRLEGQSATNTYSVGGWGFAGGQTVGYRTYAEMSWTNDSSQFTRWLCGESDYITHRTRVSAGG